MDFSQFKTKKAAIAWVKETKGLEGAAANKYLIDKVPKEKYYQGKIIEWIKKNVPQAFVWKATQGAYSRSGIPDVCVIINGRFYGFEIKRPFFGVTSQMQIQTIKQIKKAGGKAYIVTYAKEVAAILQEEIGRHQKKCAAPASTRIDAGQLTEKTVGAETTPREWRKKDGR